MKLELVLPRELYLLGENISLDVQLTNTGAAAVDVPNLDRPDTPQPVFSLRGPSYPNGVTFNIRDARPGAAAIPPGPVATYRLSPGQMMEAGFDLNSIQSISEPGEYSLSARVDWGGWSAEAAPVKFRVERAKFLESSLGVDVFPDSVRTLRAVWIAESQGRRLLGESFFYESRPDLGEIKLTGTRIIRELGSQASNPFCPWVNFDRMEAVKFWHGWQDGSLLVAFSDDEAKPRTFDMKSKKARIVQPALMSKSGELDVLVLGEDRRTLQLIRFPRQEGEAAVAWTVSLPEESVAQRIGIGPQTEGGSRVAVSISQIGAKMAIRLIRMGEKSADVGPASLVDDAFTLPVSEPSVTITADGTVHAAVLFARHPGLRTLALANLTLGRDGKSRVAVSNAGLAQTAVMRAWTAHPVAFDGPMASRWLIRTAQGVTGGGTEPLPVAVDAAVVDFLRMSAATYVLALDPDRGPRLVSTDF